MNALDMLTETGLEFRINPEWETASASRFRFDPTPGGTAGVLIHHTVSNKANGPMPSEHVIVNGRPGLAGPLSQFLLGRDGVVLLVSQNRCNHAGRGVKAVLDNCNNDVLPPDFGEGAYNARLMGSFRGGNGEFWGIEVENNGVGERYPDIQIGALVKLLAGLSGWQGWNPLTRIIHHREWTSRKIDMSFKGPIRKMVADFIATEDFDIPDQPDDDPGVSGARPVLRRGAKGSPVKTLQKLLKSVGIDVAVDGDFGPKTEAAINNFQRSRDLTVDGIVGPFTWASLFAASR